MNFGDKNRTFSNALIGDVFKVEITSKGQNIPHFITPDDKIAFQTMTRKVDEIVQIETDDKDNYTVYFSYSGTPTEPGKAIVFDRDIYKYKGKAIIKYDVFTKQYLLDNLFWSHWDRLEWGNTSWVAIEGGKKVIKATKQ